MSAQYRSFEEWWQSSFYTPTLEQCEKIELPVECRLLSKSQQKKLKDLLARIRYSNWFHGQGEADQAYQFLEEYIARLAPFSENDWDSSIYTLEYGVDELGNHLCGEQKLTEVVTESISRIEKKQSQNVNKLARKAWDTLVAYNAADDNYFVPLGLAKEAAGEAMEQCVEGKLLYTARYAVWKAAEEVEQEIALDTAMNAVSTVAWESNLSNIEEAVTEVIGEAVKEVGLDILWTDLILLFESAGKWIIVDDVMEEENPFTPLIAILQLGMLSILLISGDYLLITPPAKLAN